MFVPSMPVGRGAGGILTREALRRERRGGHPSSDRSYPGSSRPGDDPTGRRRLDAGRRFHSGRSKVPSRGGYGFASAFRIRSFASADKVSRGDSPGLSPVVTSTPHRLADQEKLPFVSRAELADEEVEAYADPLSKGEGVVHRLGDEPCHVLAGKHQGAFSVFLSNHRVSRHRRSCIRAR